MLLGHKDQRAFWDFQGILVHQDNLVSKGLQVQQDILVHQEATVRQVPRAFIEQRSYALLFLPQSHFYSFALFNLFTAVHVSAYQDT